MARLGAYRENRLQAISCGRFPRRAIRTHKLFWICQLVSYLITTDILSVQLFALFWKGRLELNQISLFQRQATHLVSPQLEAVFGNEPNLPVSKTGPTPCVTASGKPGRSRTYLLGFGDHAGPGPRNLEED